jgi:hypothetical protein
MVEGRLRRGDVIVLWWRVFNRWVGMICDACRFNPFAT